MAAPITLSASVEAPPAAVYEALTVSNGLSSFWTPDSKAEPRVGTLSVFGFGPVRLEMRVDELRPSELVAWTCVNDFPMDPHCWRGTKVAWKMSEHELGGTDVLLEHGGWPESLPQAAVASTAFNWALILRALKGFLETGDAVPVFGRRPVGAGLLGRTLPDDGDVIRATGG